MKLEVHIRQKPFEEAMARKSLSLQDLAKSLGISRVYLSNLKSEKLPDYRASGQLRGRMMKVLGVIFDDIFVIEWKNKEKK